MSDENKSRIERLKERKKARKNDPNAPSFAELKRSAQAQTTVLVERSKEIRKLQQEKEDSEDDEKND